MEGMNKTVLVIGSMVSAMVLACMATVLTATLVGAGDIAGCDFKHDRKAVPQLLRSHLGQIQEAHEAHPWQPRVRHLLRGEALLRLLRMACGQANPRLLLLRSRLLAHRGPQQHL